jgi:hypothetical protein
MEHKEKVEELFSNNKQKAILSDFQHLGERGV